MQFLPLVVLVATRRGLGEVQRVRLAFVVATSYFSLFAILLWQALRAQSLLRPDATTLTALSMWVVVTIITSWTIVARRPVVRSHAMIY
jgi:hypothetical protein